MSSSTNVAPEASTWRFKAGIAIVGLCILLWVMVPVGAALGVPASRIAAFTGIVFIANKILLLLCVAVMGKSGFQQLKRTVFGAFSGLVTEGPVSRPRHVIGLIMFCLPIFSAMAEPYFDKAFPGVRPGYWQTQLIGDLMLVVSFFVLGGDFWGKVRALFIRNARVVETPS